MDNKGCLSVVPKMTPVLTFRPCAHCLPIHTVACSALQGSGTMRQHRLKLALDKLRYGGPRGPDKPRRSAPLRATVNLLSEDACVDVWCRSLDKVCCAGIPQPRRQRHQPDGARTQWAEGHGSGARQWRQ